MSDLIEKVAEAMYDSAPHNRVLSWGDVPRGLKNTTKLEAKTAIKTVLEEMLKDRTPKSLFRWNVEKFAMKHGITLEKEQ